jgi:hypothetical protein
MLNQNQVVAAAHFVRRLKSFMRHLIQYPTLLGGQLTDYVIRYETQGRGSVHAHMLWWIKRDKKYIPEQDVIKLDPDLVLKCGLAVKKCEQGEQIVDDFIGPSDPPDTQPAQASAECPEGNSEIDCGSSQEADGRAQSSSPPPTQPVTEDQIVRLYNEEYLSHTNANVWALKNPENIRKKLHIGLQPIESLSYVNEIRTSCLINQGRGTAGDRCGTRTVHEWRTFHSGSDVCVEGVPARAPVPVC